MRRRLADTGSNTVQHFRDKILDREPLFIHFRLADEHPDPNEPMLPNVSGQLGSQAPEPKFKGGSVYSTRWWVLLGNVSVSYCGVVSNDQ